MRNKKLFGKLLILSMVVSILLISCVPQPNEPDPIEPEEQAEPTEPVETIEPAEPQETVEPEEPEEPEAAEVVVTMTSNAFTPAQITVEAGTTVLWDNTSNIAHTVTSGTRGAPTGEFDVRLQPGETFSYTFEETRVVDYYCIPHPGMDGIVTVE